MRFIKLWAEYSSFRARDAEWAQRLISDSLPCTRCGVWAGPSNARCGVWAGPSNARCMDRDATTKKRPTSETVCARAASRNFFLLWPARTPDPTSAPSSGIRSSERPAGRRHFPPTLHHRKEKERSESTPRTCPPEQSESEASGEERELSEDADGYLQHRVRRRGAAAAPLPLRMSPLQPQAQGNVAPAAADLLSLEP